jgi:putative membrane-bound dehydrogenase-like protein
VIRDCSRTLKRHHGDPAGHFSETGFSTMNRRLLPTLTLVLFFPAAALGQPDPGADGNALPSVPAGFEVKFFAKEPLVRQPCSMAFDAKGRLFVGMGPQYRNPKPDTPGDSVVIVEDTDGDGVADKVKVFATGFNCIQSLAWHGRDLWIANSPDLTIVRDLDGDDEADEYIRVYTDLGNLEHALHGLNWAPDGKLYMSKGNSKGYSDPKKASGPTPRAFMELAHGKVHPEWPAFPEPMKFTKENYKRAYHTPPDDQGREGGVLRCDDGGGNLEIVSRGMRNPWDITLDDGFNWLGTDNDANEGDRVFMPFWNAHFGWNHPWSAHWTHKPHPPSAPVSLPNFDGSGTGVIFCDSPQFPPEYRKLFFINDWLRKTTFAWKPKWEGALMNCEGGTWKPFISGGKSLFRPTDLEVGPDGALWVLGWSRYYGAEPPSAIKDGKMMNEGRIVHVRWKDAKPANGLAAKRKQPLSKWSVAELIDDFEGPLPVWRIDAADELVRRGSAAKADLIASLRGGKLSTMQETWTAWTLGRMLPDDPAIEEYFTALLDAGLAAEPCDRLMANRPVPRIVYGCLHLPSICRSAHGRRGHRVSRAKPTPPARRPRGVSSLRAASAREDAAPQDRVGEPRELARVARSRRAARAGIRRGRTPRLSRVRAPLLRLRPRGLHDVPHGIRRGILLQGPRRLPVLQRPPHGPDGRAFCRSRHPAGARAAVGDLRAQAIAGHACRPTPSRRRTQRSYRRGQSPRPIWPRLQSGCAAA